MRKRKHRNRRKINVVRVLIIVLIIYIIICFVMFLYKEPVRHYEITGNSYLKDVDILRSARLNDYPPFISINRKKTRRLLRKNDLIKDAKVSYGWNFTINIKVEENKPLFIIKAEDMVYLLDGRKIENNGHMVGIPTLLNETPDKILKQLAESLVKVDDGVLSIINEIEYSPSYSKDNKVIDEGRFLLSMNDYNLVYITAKRADLLNKYLDIIATKEIKSNGTLYLDGHENNYYFRYPTSASSEG